MTSVLGKQIRLFLADGTPGGLLTAEIMNWSGHVAAVSRSDLAELLGRPEAKRTGVYVLLGDDPETGEPCVYVGEADDVSSRLRSHARSHDSGGKDFWDLAIILTSKDSNLTKAHARYIESRLIGLAASAHRARVENSTAPTPIQLPEADVSDMEYFISQALIVLPVVGTSVFRQPKVRSKRVVPGNPEVVEQRESPPFILKVPKHGITATAQDIDGEFVVLQGSIARGSWVGTDRHKGYSDRHAALQDEGALEPAGAGRSRFTRDVVFTSPSAAGAVVTGRACNGRTAWVTVDGVQFGQWQERGLAE